MQLVNLTPHAVAFVSEEGVTTLTVQPSGTVARVSCTTERTGVFHVDGVDIPVTATVFGEVENLPAPAEDTVYIVSSLVASRVNRDDVLVPNESVRDAAGRIIGCKSLGRV